MPLPQFLQPVLWSYDLSKMDKRSNRWTIITQLLNYGDKKAINWLMSNYSPAEIKKVLLHPARGVWFRDKLRYWLAVYNLMIDPLEFEVAIRDLNPTVELNRAFLQRKGLIKQ